MSSELKKSFSYLKEAGNFGSLIPVSEKSADEIDAVTQKLKSKGSPDFIEAEVLEGLSQLKYLSPRYHCVITNPPYMGGKGMNARLSEWVKSNYPDSKSDLFAMFIERCLSLTVKTGMTGMITMQSWMFLSSFEKLREKILNNATILSMAHLGARAFDSIGGEVVSTTAFVLGNEYMPDYKGAYLRLVDGRSEVEKNRMLLEAIK
jgi:type II restriction/modification system DNA methylase subunit YeeA